MVNASIYHELFQANCSDISYEDVAYTYEECARYANPLYWHFMIMSHAGQGDLNQFALIIASG